MPLGSFGGLGMRSQTAAFVGVSIVATATAMPRSGMFGRRTMGCRAMGADMAAAGRISVRAVVVAHLRADVMLASTCLDGVPDTTKFTICGAGALAAQMPTMRLLDGPSAVMDRRSLLPDMAAMHRLLLLPDVTLTVDLAAIAVTPVLTPDGSPVCSSLIPRPPDIIIVPIGAEREPHDRRADHGDIVGQINKFVAVEIVQVIRTDPTAIAAPAHIAPIIVA